MGVTFHDILFAYFGFIMFHVHPQDNLQIPYDLRCCPSIHF